jgi:hypothetical protein
MKRPGKLHLGLAVLVLLLLLLVGAFVGLRLYLSSNRVAQRVADHLRAILGGTVRVGKAEIGLQGNSTLRNVEVFKDKDDTPWFRADEIVADLSVLSLLGGEAIPDRIALNKTQLVLRFDADGHLLTHLPTGHGAAQRFPRVHIEQGTITLDQEDRPPMIIQGITADASARGMVFEVGGTVTDPYWGNWTAKGSFDSSQEGPTSGDAALELDTPHADVTRAKLRGLPFVSKKVWQAVHAEGTTPIRFTLAFNTARKGVHYHFRPEPP